MKQNMKNSSDKTFNMRGKDPEGLFQKMYRWAWPKLESTFYLLPQTHDRLYPDPQKRDSLMKTVYLSLPASVILKPTRSSGPETEDILMNDTFPESKTSQLFYISLRRRGIQLKVAPQLMLMEEVSNTPTTCALQHCREGTYWGCDKKFMATWTSLCDTHCLHLSGGMVVSMAATSWQQCANDDGGSLHDGFSRSLQSCHTHTHTQKKGEVTEGYSEVHLTLN